MAKSMRSKRLKRLRAIKRELVEPLNQNKEAAKLAAQAAALAAPKLPVRSPTTTTMEIAPAPTVVSPFITNSDMDVEMAEGSQSSKFLKPVGGIGKKMKKKIKMAKRKGHGKGGKGKIKRKNNV